MHCEVSGAVHIFGVWQPDFGCMLYVLPGERRLTVKCYRAPTATPRSCAQLAQLASSRK
jgi:hypothetical protein